MDSTAARALSEMLHTPDNLGEVLAQPGVELGYVYFIREVPLSRRKGSASGFIKIGHSNSPDGARRRLSTLQIGNRRELDLLSCRRGVEDWCHRILKPWRERGEWFRPSCEVLLMSGAPLDQGVWLRCLEGWYGRYAEEATWRDDAMAALRWMLEQDGKCPRANLSFDRPTRVGRG